MCSRRAVTGRYTLESSSCILRRAGGIGRRFLIRVQILRFQERARKWFSATKKNAGPEMRPFSEPTVIVPIREGTRNGSEFRAHFWPRCSPFLNALFEFSIHKKWLQTDVAVEIAIFHNLSLFYAANMTA